MTDNVVTALAKVMDELPAIGKDGQAAASQGGYAYRGIEQITRHAQGLFAKHGVVFVPRVESAEVIDITVAQKPWTDTRLLVSYDVYGPGGTDDKLTVGPIFAIGRDNADKGANKAMTQAFKYALLQVLCISDAKDDGDGQTHEADAVPNELDRFIELGWRDRDEHDRFRAHVKAEATGHEAAFAAWWKAERLAWPIHHDRLDSIVEKLAALRAGDPQRPFEETSA